MYSQKQCYYKGTETLKWFKEFNNFELVINHIFYKNGLPKIFEEYENNILINYKRFNNFGKIVYLKEYNTDGKYYTCKYRYYKKYFTIKLFIDDKLVDYMALDLITERHISNIRKPKNILKQIYSSELNYNAMVGYEIYNDLLEEFLIFNYPDIIKNSKFRQSMFLLVYYLIPKYFMKIEKDMSYNKIIKHTKLLIKNVVNDFKLYETIHNNKLQELVIDYMNNFNFLITSSG